MHAVRHWQPPHHVVAVHRYVHRVARHVYHAATTATPPPGLMTACQRIAGPILAGGLVLLPPASAVPPAGGIGGFPAAVPSEYGAPGYYGPGGFASPGFAGPGGFYGPSPYSPAGFYGPGGTGGSPGGPLLFAQAPTGGPIPGSTPGTPVPDTNPQSAPIRTPGTPDLTPTPDTPSTDGPITTTRTPGTAENLMQPGGPTSPGGGPPNTTPPDQTPTGPGGSPGTGEMTPTPEPSSLAILATACLAVFLIRRRRA